jgi:hypothetical protein
MSGILLDELEIAALTGDMVLPRCQVRLLQQRGFVRARLERGKVVLERAHYEAVCRGEFGGPAKAEQVARPQLRAIK